MTNLSFFVSKFKSKYQFESDQLRLSNALREELQLMLLEAIYSISWPEKIYFMGGTCLHLSHQLPRFSEDLDFSLEKPNLDFDLSGFVEQLNKKLNPEASGFFLKLNVKDTGNVKKIMFKFSKLLYDLGLAPMENTNIQINFECDVNPPLGASTEIHQLSSLYDTFYINQFDIATCFAGKIGALLCRQYTKGRDYFDIQWLLRNNLDLKPNLEYLRHRLAQSDVTLENDDILLSKSLYADLMDKINTVDMGILENDLKNLVQMSFSNFQLYIDNYKQETSKLLSGLLLEKS